MSARKLAYQGMVLGPVILLGLLGLGARAYEDPYEIRHMSERDQALVAAYTEPVRAALPVTTARDAAARREAACRAARLWVEYHHAGKLEPLPITCGGGKCDYSAKYEISVTRMRLLSEVASAAEVNRASGNARASAEDLMLALHLCQINKSADLDLLASAARRQVRLVGQLRSVVATLDGSNRKRVADELLLLALEERQSVEFLTAKNGAAPSDGEMRQCVELIAPRHRGLDREVRQANAEDNSLKRKLVAACYDQRVQLSAMRRLATELGLSPRGWPCGDWSTSTVTTVSADLRPARYGYASNGKPFEAYTAVNRPAGGY